MDEVNPPIPLAPNENDLLERLQSLLPAQFDEVVYRLKVPPEYLSHCVPQTMRSIEVLRYLKQKNRLGELDEVLVRRLSIRRRRNVLAIVVVVAAVAVASVVALSYVRPPPTPDGPKPSPRENKAPDPSAPTLHATPHYEMPYGMGYWTASDGMLRQARALPTYHRDMHSVATDSKDPYSTGDGVREGYRVLLQNPTGTQHKLTRLTVLVDEYSAPPPRYVTVWMPKGLERIPTFNIALPAHTGPIELLGPEQVITLKANDVELLLAQVVDSKPGYYRFHFVAVLVSPQGHSTHTSQSFELLVPEDARPEDGAGRQVSVHLALKHREELAKRILRLDNESYPRVSKATNPGAILLTSFELNEVGTSLTWPDERFTAWLLDAQKKKTLGSSASSSDFDSIFLKDIGLPVDLGERLLAAGKYQRAVEVLRDFLLGHPNHSEAYPPLMAAYLQQHKLDEAELLWQQLQSPSLRNTYGYFMAGLGYALDSSKARLASELVDGSRQFFPDSQEMLGARLGIERKMRTHDPVADIASTCRFLMIASDKKLNEMRRIVSAWAHQGLEAETYTRLLTSLRERCPGVVYWDVRSFSKLWHLDPHQVISPSRLTAGLSAHQLRALGMSMLGTGRWPLAAKAFEAIPHRSRSDAILLADAYYYLERYAEARALYLPALKDSPSPTVLARAALNCAKLRSGPCMLELGKLALVPVSPDRKDLLSLELLPPRVRAVFGYASFVTTPNAPKEPPPLLVSMLVQNWFLADPLSEQSISKGNEGLLRTLRALRRETDLLRLLLQDMEVDVRPESAMHPLEEQLFIETIVQGARTPRAAATEFLAAMPHVMPSVKATFMRKPHGDLAVLVSFEDTMQVVEFTKDAAESDNSIDAEDWQRQQIATWLGGKEAVEIAQLPYFKPLDQNGIKAEAFYEIASHHAYRRYDFDGAMQIMSQKALALDPSYQDGWYRMAEWSFLSGKLAECKKNAAKAQAMDPFDQRSTTLLKQCRSRSEE